jgi:hypothetical protein
MDQAWPIATRMSSGYVVVLYQLLYLDLKFSSAQLSHFNNILWDFGELMFLLEPNGEGRGRSVGLFYCLILSVPYPIKWEVHIRLNLFFSLH